MSSNSKHSGLITKIRAMEGKLLKDSVYSNMLSMNKVSEIFSYLRDNTVYRDVLIEADENHEVHRNQLEHLLIHSLYNDFNKLYKFANPSERNFLQIIYLRFEIDLLKKSLSNLNNPLAANHKLTYSDLFLKHSHIDFTLLFKSKSIDEFTSHLVGSKYYKLFNKLINLHYTKIADYETALDIYYYTSIWKNKKRFDPHMQKIIESIIGTEIDLYNIKCLYRCKYIYTMTPEQINSYIIPVSYKLNKKTINTLKYSTTFDEFLKYFNSCPYSTKGIEFDINKIDISFRTVLYNTHNNFIKANPNSLAKLYIYFDKKRYEIFFTTRTIEKVRYK